MTSLRIGLAVVMTAAFAGHADAACRTVVGSADMVTRDLAKFMANAALKNAIEAKGLKPSGEVALSCKDDTFTTYCKATRKACN